MLRLLCLLTVTLVFSHSTLQSNVFWNLKNGLIQNLNYVDKIHEKCNADCLLGVEFASVFLADLYQKGTSKTISEVLLDKIIKIVQKVRPRIKEDQKQFWIGKYLLDPEIWQKKIHFNKYVYPWAKMPNKRKLENIFKNETKNLSQPTTDFCMQDIVNKTKNSTPKTCFLDQNCYEKYFIKKRKLSSGYILTHQLLINQLAQAKKCKTIDATAKKLMCSNIYQEAITFDYYDHLDQVFDLFLEQIILCTYEGYYEFFKIEWLQFILKTQKSSGCFSAYASGYRLKRNTNILADGCADHTTGLGTAVLAAYFNFFLM